MATCGSAATSSYQRCEEWQEALKADLEKQAAESCHPTETLANVALADARVHRLVGTCLPVCSPSEKSFVQSTAVQTPLPATLCSVLADGGYFSSSDGKVTVPVPPLVAIANPSFSVPMAVPPVNLPMTTVSSRVIAIRPAVTSDHSKVDCSVNSQHPSSSQGKVFHPAQLQPTNPQSGDTNKQSPVPPLALPSQSTSNDTVQSNQLSSTSSSPGQSPVSAPSPTNGFEPESKGKRRRSYESLDANKRRQRVLLRNREAATRCREKRKLWIQKLEKQAEQLMEQNNQLQAEVTTLRTKLKMFLLAHKDCSVSRQPLQIDKMTVALRSMTDSSPTPNTGTVSPAQSVAPLVVFPLNPECVSVCPPDVPITVDSQSAQLLHQVHQLQTPNPSEQQSAQQQQQQQQQQSPLSQVTPDVLHQLKQFQMHMVQQQLTPTTKKANSPEFGNLNGKCTHPDQVQDVTGVVLSHPNEATMVTTTQPLQVSSSLEAVAVASLAASSPLNSPLNLQTCTVDKTN